jgi:hypothetical protein
MEQGGDYNSAEHAAGGVTGQAHATGKRTDKALANAYITTGRALADLTRETGMTRDGQDNLRAAEGLLAHGVHHQENVARG